MDYIDWLQRVLAALVKFEKKDPEARSRGFSVYAYAELAVEIGCNEEPVKHGGEVHAAIMEAMECLIDAGLVKETASQNWKVTTLGHEHSENPIPLWEDICSLSLDEPFARVLSIVNPLSPQCSDKVCYLAPVTHEILLDRLDDGTEYRVLRAIADELKRERFLSGTFLGWSFEVKSTYKGLVWETRRAFTKHSAFIDSLVAEWETTNVEFKQEVHTHNKGGKAELVKDILGLANTQASGRRYLIIGFNDKTRNYYGPPDNALNQNNLEQILSVYTSPAVQIRYEVIDYPQGKVGQLEVLRDKKHLPYKVAKSVGGDKKRITEGQVFVRHGSQTVVATPEELESLISEAEWARSHE